MVKTDLKKKKKESKFILLLGYPNLYFSRDFATLFKA